MIPDRFDAPVVAQRGETGAHPRHEVGDEDKHGGAEHLGPQHIREHGALLAGDARDVGAELFGELDHHRVHQPARAFRRQWRETDGGRTDLAHGGVERAEVRW